MKSKQIILTRHLPKTGQVISYITGDDGYYEAGWWKGRKVANNKIRFKQKIIGSDVVVIDKATGLMWAADGDGVGCYNGYVASWDECMMHCNSMTFAGKSDWRMPNVKELMSIVDYGINLPCIQEPPFINTKLSDYWTSTTYCGATVFAFTIAFATGLVLQTFTEDDSLYVRGVRGGL